MDTVTYLQAAFLGIVEGVTEFLPISSTGHLILLSEALGFRGPEGMVFEVAIQSGAIAAVLVVYFQRVWGMASGMWTNPTQRHLVITLLLAFFPSVILGVAFHDFIKSVLFSPIVVAWSLLLGGMALWVIERVKPAPRFHTLEALTYKRALAIGCAQCVAMIPGVSRSGATIMGALLLGLERKVAAEFSFLLALPTMAGATVYDLYKNRETLSMDDGALIAIGWLFAFLTGVLVIRWLLGFLTHHGFTPFAYYRMLVGVVLLLVLM